MDRNSLVENEGVNAGSQQFEDGESDPNPGADVRSGGRPDLVQPIAPTEDLDPGAGDGDSDLLGATDEGERSPGPPSGSGGQDAGSIE
jgi:hypothetical protein